MWTSSRKINVFVRHSEPNVLVPTWETTRSDTSLRILQVTFTQRKRGKTVLWTPSLKIVTFWHFCAKVPCRSFQKAFVFLVAAGYCAVRLASVAEGQIWYLRGEGAGYATTGHMQVHEYIYICWGLFSNVEKHISPAWPKLTCCCPLSISLIFFSY